MKPVLLFAENKKEIRETWATVLRENGYNVLTAENPDQARYILKNSFIDLAILDVRLDDDDNDNDRSGLEIALDETYIRIPKIIMTKYNQSPESLAKVFGLSTDKIPYALEYVDKGKGPTALLDPIRRSLDLWPRLRMSTITVSEQTKADYNIVLKQASRNYAVALIISILGFVVIFVGIGLAWSDKITIGIVGTASGILLQVLSYLFFRRLDLSNQRMDLYHRELLETYWLELLMAASERLPATQQIACTEKAINAAVVRWLAPQTVVQPSSVVKHNEMEEQ